MMNQLHSRPKKRFLTALALLFALSAFLFISACSKETDYFSYVSELRDNILLAQSEQFSLRIYSVRKETPYVSDGIPRETSQRTEIYLAAPAGDKDYELTFSIKEKTYGGDMSYDNVKGEYYYSCTLDLSAINELACTIVCGESRTEMTALSVRNENTLSPQNVLQIVRDAEKELFAALTDKYGFAGEIYIRMLYEDAPYYYVGVIDRNGNTTAFLLNGESGKILARRQS